MMVNRFWSEYCPSRGAILTHAFGPGDPPGICAHCHQAPDQTTRTATVTGGEAQTVHTSDMPLIDVAARLKALGLVRAVEETDEEVIREEVNLREPQMRTSFSQPTGPTDGLGRGPLTTKQKARLLAVRGYQDWQDRRDAP